MEVILVNKTSGIVENVIYADSIERAQTFYPEHELKERVKGMNVGPGFVARDNRFYAPDEVPQTKNPDDPSAETVSWLRRIADKFSSAVTTTTSIITGGK